MSSRHPEAGGSFGMMALLDSHGNEEALPRPRETPEGSPERDPDLARRKKPRRGLPLSDWGLLQRRLDPETTVPKTDTDVAESLLNLSSPSNSTLNLSRAVSLLDDAELGDLASAEAQFMKDLQERSAKQGLLGAACRVRVEV